jgi:hypothetical protein
MTVQRSLRVSEQPHALVVTSSSLDISIRVPQIKLDEGVKAASVQWYLCCMHPDVDHYIVLAWPSTQQ